MKKVFTLLFAITLFGTVKAQTNAAEVELFQSIFNTEKKAMVAQFMNLSDEEGALFWDIYNAYETERSELGKQRIQLLQNYADQYASLNDESADVLLKEAMKLKKSRSKVRDKYTNKVKKALGAKRALQFAQFEQYLDRAIGLYIMENVPFVGEYN